jgi:hypothetical protein
MTALELAAEQQMYGAEYVQAILVRPKRAAPSISAGGAERRHWVGVPGREEVERSLSHYEHDVANRESLLHVQEARP